MPKCEYCGIRGDACMEDNDGTFCIYCRTLALEMRGYNVPMPDVGKTRGGADHAH